MRTLLKRELWVWPSEVVDTDPLSGAGGWLAANQRRFLAGRALHEQTAPLSPLPDAAALQRVPKGAAFVFRINPEALGDPIFEPPWFEPVGHTWDTAIVIGRIGSPKNREFANQGQGVFTLDYHALGSWLPDDSTVVTVWDGTALAIQVLDPWGKGLGVTPAWDGRPSPIPP